MFVYIQVSFVVFAMLIKSYQSDPVRTYLIAPDHSLSATSYIEKGVPANDRIWTGQDYGQAAAVFQTLAAGDATQLPRYASPKSGAVFARIVSRDNLRFFRGGSLTQQQRLAAELPILQNLGKVIVVYTSSTTRERIFDSEVVELLRYTLEVSNDIIQLSEAFIASLPADDPERDTRAKGREQMRQGMAAIVTGCLTTLTEKDSYRPSELVRLAQTLETTLPSMSSFLPTGTQQEIPILLQRMIEREPDSDLKERLTRIAAALHNSRPH